MNESLQQLLNIFDQLLDTEKRKAIVAILDRMQAAEGQCSRPSEQELVLNAEQLFLELDRWEGIVGRV